MIADIKSLTAGFQACSFIHDIKSLAAGFQACSFINVKRLLNVPAHVKCLLNVPAHKLNLLVAVIPKLIRDIWIKCCYSKKKKSLCALTLSGSKIYLPSEIKISSCGVLPTLGWVRPGAASRSWTSCRVCDVIVSWSWMGFALRVSLGWAWPLLFRFFPGFP